MVRMVISIKKCEIYYLFRTGNVLDLGLNNQQQF